MAGCKDAETIYIETENDAFSAVCLQVVDSVFIDKRILIVEPYQKYVIESGNKYNVDTTGYAKITAKWEHQKDSLLKTPTQFTIAVEDSLLPFDKEIINKEFKDNSMVISVIPASGNPLLSKKISSKKYRFTKLSNYRGETKTKDYKTALKKTDGILYFSHIIFNKNYDKGVFEAGFAIAPKAGSGFKITIIRKGEKWIISSIKCSYET